MKICIIYSFKSELYIKNTFLKREFIKGGLYMSVRKTMFVKENSFRKLDDPFNDAAKKYIFYVKICDVPEGIPMATNPRDQKLTSGVAQAIKESLESNDGYFHL